MFPSDLGTTWDAIALVAVSTVAAYLTLIVFSRVAGLRSFAEMTNFDMASTIAFGSIVATTAVATSTPLIQGVVALAVLFLTQALLARVRRHLRSERVLDSGPLLLMDGSEALSANMARAQMTDGDLRSKLRLAGITRYEQVAAVVLETTGEVSVLRAGEEPVEPDLLENVTRR